MATIALEELKFKAPIGVYPEEKINKNDILVNVSMEVNSLFIVKELSDTINYEEVYHIIEKEVMQETDLLEDTLQRIILSIEKYCSELKNEKVILSNIVCQIKKLTPPIKGNIGSVWIEDELLNVRNLKSVEIKELEKN